LLTWGNAASQHFKISTANNTLDVGTKFLTVNNFLHPTIDSWPDRKKVCFCAFNWGNPLPGRFQGKDIHTVDALYQSQAMTNQFPTQADLDIGVNFELCVG